MQQAIMGQKQKTEIIVGFEPTGYYWFMLGDYLQGKGYKLGIVNLFHVKGTRKNDDNSQTKSDNKDSKNCMNPSSSGKSISHLLYEKELIQMLL